MNCGPINNSKSKAVLSFEPTPIERAIQETVDFFADADKFTTQKKKVEKKIKKAIEVK